MKQVKKRCMAGILVVLSVVCLFFIACGQKGNEGTEASDKGGEADFGMVWIPEWITLDVTYKDSFLIDWKLDGQNLYYALNGSEGNTNCIYIGKMNILEDTYPTVEKWKDGFTTCLFTDTEGKPWCIRGFTDADKNLSWFAEPMDNQDEEASGIDITKLVPEDGSVQDAVLDENGNLYLLTVAPMRGEFLLKILNEKGECMEEVEVGSSPSGLEGIQGKGVLCEEYGSSQGAKLYDLSGQCTELKEVYNTQGKMSPSLQEDGTLFFLRNTSLMRYDMDKGQAKEILDCKQCDMMPEYVEDISSLSDKRIAVLQRDWNVGSQLEIALLKQVPKEEVQQKKVITLGTAIRDENLTAAVTRFNKQNSEYQIDMIIYAENDWAAGLQKMNQDIVNGNGPDLIDLRWAGDNLSIYLEKGILEDLTPYLVSSENIQKEDFLPNLLENYTVNGILYTIPTAFSIDTVVAKSSMAGEKTGWTVEEFMKFAEKQPKDVGLLQFESKVIMLQYLLGRNNRNILGTEAEGTIFRKEELQTFLEFSNQYSAEVKEVPYEEIPARLSDGTLVLYETRVNTMRDLQTLRNYFGEAFTCIGYPTLDGQAGSYFAGEGMMFGINSQSEYKDVAWEFLSSQLTQAAEMQNVRKGQYGFPSRQDALKACFEEAQDANWMYDDDGEIMLDEDGNPMQAPKLTIYETAQDGTGMETKYYASAPEEVEEIKGLIASIKPEGVYNPEILNMISEEADSYFYGQKSLKDAMAIIESKINLYLSERN